MAKIQELIVTAILPALKAVEKAEMEDVLSVVKENNTPEIYKNTLLGLHTNFSLLKEAALKTRTRIDDGIVDLVLEAVKQNANAGGIDLS
ncbi:hypothetical protein BH11BAC5_BH11BAC5_33530 [soil metagenome]